MSIVERAAKRLEELYKAGVFVTSLDQSAQAGALDASQDGGAPRGEGPFSPADLTTPAPIGVRGTQPHLRSATIAVSHRVSIDLQRLGQSGFVIPEDPRSQIAEEFRVIKRPLIRNAMGKGVLPIKNGNLIMVTSALPGEGKSSSALNLAMSIAMELDSTVLLVDADVAKPSLPQLLGISPELGLLDVLTDRELDLSDVLLGTNVDRLRVLPSGTAHPRATELLASEAMTNLLQEMASRYSDRMIIFDSPPLLLTTEARALAAHMGQIVLVVEAEQTTHSAVTQALAMIETCPVKLLLLNKTRLSASGSYYGYHGGKGYGEYGYGR